MFQDIIVTIMLPFLIWISTGISLTQGAKNCSNHEDCLFKDLFSTYNRFSRPVLNTTHSVQVRVSLVLNSLLDIDERDKQMKVVGFFRTFWPDEMLVWDPADYGGVDHLIIPADRVWTPDIAVSNSVSGFYQITYKRDFHVHIYNFGQIRWAWGGVVTTSCNIDLSLYPFDTQECHLEIENWMFQENTVNLTILSVIVRMHNPHPVWEILDTKAERETRYDNFASLVYTIVWKRKSLYYYINIIIPVAFMLVVAMGVFFLPANCGEKMTLAITVILAFSVFQIVIMDTTPVNSDTVPKITLLVLIVMTIATFSLIISMIVVTISNKCPSTRPPRWLRVFCFRVLARIMCMTNSVPPGYHEHEDEDTSSVTTETTDDGTGGKTPKKNPFRSKVNSHGLLYQERGLWNEDRGYANPVYAYGHTNMYNTEDELINNYFEEKQANKFSKGPVGGGHLDGFQLEYVTSSLGRIIRMMEQTKDHRYVAEEWKYIAKILDRMFFWFTFLAAIVAICYVFIAVR